jgi:competence protein ComEC
MKKVNVGPMLRFITNFFDSFFSHQKDRLVLWVPVGIGLGILAYFSVASNYKISLGLSIGMGMVSMAALILSTKCFKLNILCIGLFCISLGFMSGHIRTLFFTTPVLKTSLDNPVWIRGTIEEITQGRNQKKLILSVKKIQTISQHPPKKIQLIYRAKKEKEKNLKPGDFVVLKAKLESLQGPIVPGGYDFRQQALFKQIGAQGYVLYVHKVNSPIKPSLLQQVDSLRLKLTQHFLKQLPGQEGAIASALITGDTGSLSKNTRAAFADSGTAHILAISGLHLTLIGGLLLAITRLFVGFFPFLILRFPAKKIAAILALIGAFGYLFLSGCRVPTQRAFISFGMMMVAILIDRNPLSMRLVAFAATSILLFSPEVLFTPSFQLSFAAVVGLIAFYENIQVYTPHNSLFKKILFYGFGILLSSIIASIATLPFTLYHFYKFTLQSIGSNLLMIPLLSLWVMPMCLCFVFLSWWPFGQHICGIFLKKGLTVMSFTADFFSKLPGSLIYISGFSTTSFTLMVWGGLFLALLKGKIRYSGLALIFLSILYTIFSPKPIPTLFIAEGGKNIGIVHKNHLFVSSPKTDSFLTTVWSGYAGIPPAHVHKFKAKKASFLQPPIDFYGKNIMISLEKFKIGYIKSKEHKPLPNRGDIFIDCSNNQLKMMPSLFLYKTNNSFFWKDAAGKSIIPPFYAEEGEGTSGRIPSTCASHNLLYKPSSLTNCACDPSCTIRPCSKTRMRSICPSVERR